MVAVVALVGVIEVLQVAACWYMLPCSRRRTGGQEGLLQEPGANSTFMH